MSYTINAFDHQEWHRLGLADFGDFADQIAECNMGEDAFSGYGEWFFVPGEPLPTGERVIYFGSWGNENCAGASSYTYAEIFDVADGADATAFAKRVKKWESEPEFVGEYE